MPEDALKSWGERSFLLELKPRSEYASLFVDCPLQQSACQTDVGSGDVALKKDDNDSCEARYTIDDAEVMRVSEHTIKLGPLTEGKPCWIAQLEQLQLRPHSLCAPTWADQRRLFMCKLHAQPEAGIVLLPKTLHRMAAEIVEKQPLQDWVDSMTGKSLHLHCTSCGASLLEVSGTSTTCNSDENGRIDVEPLPSDDFLTTSPSMEFFCRESCGPGCDPAAHGDCGRHSPLSTAVASGRPSDSWLPTRDRVMVSHSWLFVHSDVLDSNAINVTQNCVSCASCSTELGIIQKHFPNVFQLHLGVVDAASESDSRPYIDSRFSSTDQFFALQVLSACESQSSLKLVVRSANRTPHILLWLLDSYVVLANGQLSEEKGANSWNRNSKDSHSCTVPALKLLYKVFDASSAASDPRANGEDASVGILDLPEGAVLRLMEHLLVSSHALPPACRAVGHFYVGFLRLSHQL